MIQFSTPEELRRHYAEVTARLMAAGLPEEKPRKYTPPPRPPEPERKPPVYEMVPLQGAEPRLNFRDVVVVVSDACGLSEREIFARRRSLIYTRSRHLAWALMKACCLHLSLPIIGRMSGGYDHSTVLHGARNGVHDPRFDELKQKLEAILEERRAAVPKVEEGVYGEV